MKQLFRNGLIITDGLELTADLAVEDGRVRALGVLDGWESDEELDCTGRYILPGAVDLGLNLLDNGPFDPESEAGLGLATAQAARGGVTTVLTTMNLDGDESATQAIAAQREADTSKAFVDFGYHLRLEEWSGRGLARLRSAVEAGVTSLWIPCRDSGSPLPSPALLLAMLPEVPEDFLLLVSPYEALVIAANLARFGQEVGSRAQAWADTLTPTQEAAAVESLLRYSLGGRARLLIHGIGTHASLEAFRASRERCPRTHLAATLPHLLFHEGDEEAPRLWPPARSRSDQQGIFSAMEDGTCQFLLSGHKPRTEAGSSEADSDSGIPAQGLAVLSRFYQALHAEGVAKWRLSLPVLSQVAAADPAKLAGLYPSKGSLLPGADADIVILDPGGRTEPREDAGEDFVSPLERRTFAGRIERVYLRGILISEDDKDPGEARGQFLARRLSLR